MDSTNKKNKSAVVNYADSESDLETNDNSEEIEDLSRSESMEGELSKTKEYLEEDLLESIESFELNLSSCESDEKLEQSNREPLIRIKRKCKKIKSINGTEHNTIDKDSTSDDDYELVYDYDMQKIQEGDTIEAKMEHLKHFKVPSLSDIVETTLDEQALGEEEDFEKAERRARLKRARDIRFKTGDSENTLEKNGSATSTKTDAEYDEIDEMKLLCIEEDDDDEEDDADMRNTPKGDTIKAKMEFLKHFEIPSLSDISMDTEDAVHNDSSKMNNDF